VVQRLREELPEGEETPLQFAFDEDAIICWSRAAIAIWFKWWAETKLPFLSSGMDGADDATRGSEAHGASHSHEAGPSWDMPSR
jgi:hypothetical protein